MPDPRKPTAQPLRKVTLGRSEPLVLEIEPVPVQTQWVLVHLVQHREAPERILGELQSARVGRDHAQRLVQACQAAAEYVSQNSFGDDSLDTEVLEIHLQDTLGLDRAFLAEVVEGLILFSNEG